MPPNQDLFNKTDFFIKIPISWILKNFPGLSAGSGWSFAAKEKVKELTIVLEILRIHFAVDLYRGNT